jgi:hypothetical protein
MSPDDEIPDWDDVSRQIEVEREDGSIVVGRLEGDTAGSDSMIPEIDTWDGKGEYVPAVPFGWPRRFRFLD